jgi:hypothetical protein
MVRLITHNLLACHVKGCTSNNFPLTFKDVEVEHREAEFNSDFLMGFLPKLEWPALVNAAKQVSSTRLGKAWLSCLACISATAWGYFFAGATTRRRKYRRSTSQNTASCTLRSASTYPTFQKDFFSLTHA